RRYADLNAGVREATRLANAMHHKFAVHGLPFSGGKGVILQDDAGADDRSLFERRLTAYGKFVGRLNGVFGTGPDMGIGSRELEVLGAACEHISGIAHHAEASDATAAGVRACLERTLQGVQGKRIAIIGVGAVGSALARMLAERGASLLLADVNAERVAALAVELAADVVTPAEALVADVDALSPCAAGDVFDSAAIDALRCKVVCGAANNQLCDPDEEHANHLAARGITYVPDFVANGGAAVLLCGCSPGPLSESVETAATKVGETLGAVTARADAEGLTRLAAAIRIARSFVAARR
ncbi:NAD(P)-binding domain-containing protein, partial [Planctomycetota bacterium]|nr:NAD(P)-binding domain-containing protein [Planctomycetota bacterium]